MFFIAAALVLVTAGVFAGKTKFAPFTLEAYDVTGGTSYHPLTSSFVYNANISLSTSATPISFTSSVSGTAYSVYAYDAASSTYYRVLTAF